MNTLEDDIRAVLHSQANAMEVPEPHRNDTTHVALIDIEPTWTQPKGRHRWPIVAVAAAVVAVVVGGLMIVTRTDDPTVEVPADQPTTVAPTTTVVPHRESGAFEFGPGVTYIVPDGWENMNDAVIKRDPLLGMSLINAEDNFYTSSCRTTSEWDAAPVGPTVDDLVSAWANLPAVDATAARDVTIDGFDGKQIEFTAPDPIEDCTRISFRCTLPPGEPFGSTPCTRSLPGAPFEGPNVQEKVWVLDVDGSRLMIITASSADASQQDRAALDEIVASIEFG